MATAKRHAIVRPKRARPKRPAVSGLTPAELPDCGLVLGLDVSSKTVGWALFDGAELVDYGKYHPKGSKEKEHGQKLSEYRTWLLAKLKATRPDQLVVEIPYSARRRFTFGILSMYFGVALAAYFDHFGKEMPLENRLMPHAVKRLLGVTSKGATYEDRKEKMVLLINTLYGLELRYKPKDQGKVSDDDISDAIAVVHAYRTKQQRKKANA